MYIINDFLFAIQQDEISMNYEYQKKDELILNPSLKEEVSKIGTLDIDVVCDTHHNNNSLIWQLATNKSDNKNYENYKKLLDQ